MDGHKLYEKEKRPVDSKALLTERIRFQRSAHCGYMWFVEHMENFRFIRSKVITFRSIPKLCIRMFYANLTRTVNKRGIQNVYWVMQT
jgi:predicted GNAT superfamily acetyltransferase